MDDELFLFIAAWAVGAVGGIWLGWRLTRHWKKGARLFLLTFVAALSLSPGILIGEGHPSFLFPVPWLFAVLNNELSKDGAARSWNGVLFALTWVIIFLPAGLFLILRADLRAKRKESGASRKTELSV
jgi:hypothetical protein